MDALTATRRRSYTPLPIDASRGFPQSFQMLFGGQTYYFSLYVNVAAERLAAADGPLELPSEDAFLVVSVARERAGGERAVIFRRKVVAGLEYEAGEIALVFTRQRVARKNLNGQGDFGSQVAGGIAPRWA